MKQIPPESYFEVTVMRDPGLTGESYEIGMIHDLDLCFVDSFSEPRAIYSLVDALQIDLINWPNHSFLSIYKVSRFQWDEGEMSDPASGLWEQMPEWDYRVDHIRFEFDPPCPDCGGSGMTPGWVPSYANPDNSGGGDSAEPCHCKAH